MQSRATDPNQYDSPETPWTLAGAEENPSRIWFRKWLDHIVQPDALKGTQVIDIGCGVGQLFNWLKEKGAAEVTGFDPSAKNVEVAAARYPWAQVTKDTLHEFSSRRRTPFDAAMVVMVLEHVPNLEEAFAEIGSLLKEQGTLYLVVGNKNYHTLGDLSVRGAMVKSVEKLRDLPGGAVEIRTVREEPGIGRTVMDDIFWPIDQVMGAAQNAGFYLEARASIPGNPLQNGSPIAACHMLRFRKVA